MIEEKIERLQQWANSKQAPPLTMELNITNKCNLQCLSCWQRSAQVASSELSDERWLEIVRQGIKLGVKEFRFPGSGEPLFRKELFCKLSEKIKKHNAYGLLITNGTMLDENIAKKMVVIGWDNVTISIDGPDAKANDYLRGAPGTFEKSVRAAILLNEWKSKLEKKLPEVRLNIVLSNKNYDKLDKMMQLAHRLKCSAVSVQPMTVFSQLGENLKLNSTQLKKLPGHIRKAKDAASKYEIHTNLENIANTNVVEHANKMDKIIDEEIKKSGNYFLSAACFEPWYNVVVMPNGGVGPCSVFGGEGGADISKTSLEEIWYGDYFQEIRQMLLSKKLFSHCSNCCVVVFEENKRLRNELKRNG